MAKFVFNLEPLYEYRQRLQEVCQKEFGEALSRLSDEGKKLDSLKELYRKAGRELDEMKENGPDAREIEMYHSYLEGLKTHIRAQEAALVEARVALEKKRTQLVEASRDTKVMEIMKERSLDIFTRKAEKQEQKESDDLTAAKYGRDDENER